jgi:hypothetical protein
LGKGRGKPVGQFCFNNEACIPTLKPFGCFLLGKAQNLLGCPTSGKIQQKKENERYGKPAPDYGT